MILHPVLLVTSWLSVTPSVPALAQQLEHEAFLRKDDERQLKAIGLKPEQESLIAYFRKRTPNAEKEAQIQRLVRDLGNNDWEVREKAMTSLLQFGKVALTAVQEARKSPDPEIAFRARHCAQRIQSSQTTNVTAAAVRAMGRLRSITGAETLLRYLPYEEDPQVRKAILTALVKAPPKASAPLLEKAAQEKKKLRRAAAGYVLGQSSGKSARQSVYSLLQDKECEVRLWTARGLLLGNDKASVPILIQLLKEEQEIRWQAEALLLQLAKTSVPAYPAEGTQQQQQYVKAWEKWWTEKKDKLDLRSFRDTVPFRGWTILASYQTGTVWEVDRQGKTRWKLTGMKGSIDAQAINDELIVVAEYTGKRVTIRNCRTNKIVMTKTFSASPFSVQPLRNGNIFVSTTSEVLEIDRRGKGIYRKSVTTGQRITCGSRARDGRIVALTQNGMIHVWRTPTSTPITVNTRLNTTYSVQALPQGRYLVSSYGNQKVVEINSAGKTIWEYPQAQVYHAERIANDNTLILCYGQQGYKVVNRTKKEVIPFKKVGTYIWRGHVR